MSRNSLRNICRLIEQAADKLPLEQSFLADLKRSMEITASKESRKQSCTYKPSSMNCIRNMYYQRIGADVEEAETTYCMVGICNSGSDIHVRVQKAIEDMKNNGIDCEYIDVAEFVRIRNLSDIEIVGKSGMETKLHHKTLNMNFMCDGIIRYKNRYMILELKTETSSKWQRREGVDPSHYNQGTAYSKSLCLPEVLFIYINRDILDMKAYMFVPTDEMKNELVGKIEDCEGYVSRLICPPKPEDVTKKSCSYCPYRNRCASEK